MKTILKTFAAIGFGAASYITVSVAALMTSNGLSDLDYIRPIAFCAALLGGLAGWYRVK